MKTLSTQEFKDLIYDFELSKEWKYKGNKPAIIDFYADWCAPCRMLSPVLEEVYQKYQPDIEIFKVNTEETPELAQLFGVRGIPALLFIPLNEEPAMNSGFIPYESFQTAIKELFNIDAK